jgi:hypothetical protein
VRIASSEQSEGNSLIYLPIKGGSLPRSEQCVCVCVCVCVCERERERVCVCVYTDHKAGEVLLYRANRRLPAVIPVSFINIKIIIFLGSKVRRVRRADNLTAICEPLV